MLNCSELHPQKNMSNSLRSKSKYPNFPQIHPTHSQYPPNEHQVFTKASNTNYTGLCQTAQLDEFVDIVLPRPSKRRSKQFQTLNVAPTVLQVRSRGMVKPSREHSFSNTESYFTGIPSARLMTVARYFPRFWFQILCFLSSSQGSDCINKSLNVM